jgi:Spy/CpxP family protein refolding chaperone
MRLLLVASVAGLAAAPPSFAQAPYAGLQARPVKALSEQQIADLKAGRGMGLALPAELNGYPGPSHLLELAEPIGLTDAQRQTVRGLFDAMKAETILIGEQLIAQETALDALFATREATAERVAALTAEIGATQARLRAAHLRYHLSTLDLLQPAQVERYAELRGYRDGGADGEHHHHGR